MSVRDRRPMPDEAPLEDAPMPQPERHEATLEHVRLRDLSRKDWFAVLKRAGKETLEDNLTMIAQALAYSTFMAIPSVLLVTVGVFTLVAGPGTIDTLMTHLGTVMPHQATHLLSASLKRLQSRPNTGIAMTAVGGALAIWSTTGAMTSYMTGVNLAYDRKDRRGFLKRRFTAALMAACSGLAFILVAVLLIFGPPIEKYVGKALHIAGPLGWIWWLVQWPILFVALLAVFGTLLYLAPDVDHPRWRFITPGSFVATLIWLAASGAFAVYTAKFGSYNKTWGSLAAVIVMLTWLWLTGLALLFGAEINSELERSRELRQGEPAERDLRVPARA